MSQTAHDLFIGPSDLFLSLASIWEILIKSRLGKLDVPQPAGSFVIKKMSENRVSTLPVHLDHLLAFEKLPLHHRDPFDRMLIAQAVQEGWPIITSDTVFRKYPVRVIW